MTPSNTMRRIGLTTIKALEPLRLVSIFHALYDSIVAAESSAILDLLLKTAAVIEARTLACES